ncbi:hypothetical protein DL93DRAFT_2052668, partial [Clavulina sp. PMI_390]
MPKKIVRPSEAAFPAEELARKLIDNFFNNRNSMLTYILDKEEFYRRYANGDHHREDDYAALLLMVFAIGSRFTRKSDPATYKQHDDVLTAGDGYIELAEPYYRMFQSPVTLEELQGMSMLGFFQYLSGRSHPAWIIVGIVLRLGFDVGAHRKRPETTTKQAEYWKRTFWYLFPFPRVRFYCAALAILLTLVVSSTSFDLDFPAPIEGEDAPLDAFRAHLELVRIMDYTMRALYSIKKPYMLEGLLKEEYDQTLVAELDSALNEWFENIPEHLQWDPEHPPTGDNLELSVQLYINAYNISQLIHRPFIPAPGTTSKLAIPSLAICTRAARACSNILNVARIHKLTLLPGTIPSAFASSITLIISAWSALRGGSKLNYNTHILDVDKCLRYMMLVEDVYPIAGRQVDILREIADLAGMDL